MKRTLRFPLLLLVALDLAGAPTASAQQRATPTDRLDAPERLPLSLLLTAALFYGA